MMKETGIIMSGDHPKLILDGLKTITRRTWGLEFVNQEPDAWQFIQMENDLAVFRLLKKHWGDLVSARSRPKGVRGKDPNLEFLIKCPYGQVGDRLWVREAFVIENDAEYGSSEEELKAWGKDRPIKNEIGEGEYYHLIPHYRATEPEPNIVPQDADDFDDRTRWSPSIFMPRWASRILLEITEVRVERVQEISEEDAKAEGITSIPGHRIAPLGSNEWRDATYIDWFAGLWDSLNAKRGHGWDKNEWVWPISFKVVAQRAGLV